jgi:type IV pilus assembly protein PilF
MVKFAGFLFLILLNLVIAGCQTSRPPNAEEEKKITAAKMNIRLGMAYMERHDMQRAKQKLLTALDKAPDIPEPWYSMAYFLEITGNKERAKIYYLKAVEIAPDRGDVLNNYGTFLCRSGDYKGAVTYFMKATEDPKYLAQASAFENAGLCSLKIPDSKQATAFFKRALTEDPNRAASLIELSELNYRKGDYMTSRHQLDKYLQLAPPSAQSFLLERKLDAKLQA